jgi:cytochrome c-type biogenesis protein
MLSRRSILLATVAERTHLAAGSARAKSAFAVLLVGIGFSIVSGLDKRLETLAVDHSPQWLTNLTTRF